MSRYDRHHADYLRRSAPFMGWYPGAFWAGAPMYGWGAWGWPAWPAVEGYDRHELGPPRRRPEESPTYGRGGDFAARRYARSHGYDEGFAVPPRAPGRLPRYDRGYRGRW